jgi:CHRD domain
MARRTGLVAAVAVVGALAVGMLASIGTAGPNDNGNSQRMIGYFEVPSVSTVARGRFELRIRDSQLDYRLTFSDLEGAVTQAHIHFAQAGVNGGISAWLCGTTGNLAGPPGTPSCGAAGATQGDISGTITAANVQNTNNPANGATQGIAAMEFAELVAAIRAGVTYANVHSAKFPGGEIRAQIKARGGGDDDDDD